MTRVQAIVEEMDGLRDGWAFDMPAKIADLKQRILAAHRADLEEALGEPTEAELNQAFDDIGTGGWSDEADQSPKVIIASRRKRMLP